MDDILVYTDTIEEHREVNQKVLQILWENKLYLKPEKCEFEKGEIEFLRVIIRNGQVRIGQSQRQRRTYRPFWGSGTSIAISLRILGRSPSR
jgi:hypothetical protein